MKIMRILVPVDFSQGSELALEWATLLASKARGATIYLLHVTPSKAEEEAQGFAGVGYLMEKTEAKKLMSEWVKNLPPEILSFPLFMKGSIPGVVERVCQEKSIDLVIMTTRGRRGMQALLPHSTTEETVRVAPCPVLVLHRNAKTASDSRISAKAFPKVGLKLA